MVSAHGDASNSTGIDVNQDDGLTGGYLAFALVEADKTYLASVFAYLPAIVR